MFSLFSRPKRCGLCYFELPKGASSLKHPKVERKYTWRDEGQVRHSEVDKNTVEDAFDALLPFSSDDLLTKSVRVDLLTKWGHLGSSIERGCEGCRGLKELLYSAAADDNVSLSHLSAEDEVTIEWRPGQWRRSAYGLLQIALVVDASKCRGHRAYPSIPVQGSPLIKWEFCFDLDLSAGDESSARGARAHPFAYWWPRASAFGETGSSESTNRIRAWLKECDANHNHCTKHTRQLPHRVLELRSQPSQKMSIRLIEGLDEETDYVCLSHRWGPSTPNYRTLKENLSRQQQDIAWDSLPKTFQDAASVTVSLGLRYLWIDSLCIVQDDAKDWETQAAQMCDIYRGAYVTLGASCSADSTEGLFRTSPHIEIQQGGTQGPSYKIRRMPEHPTWDNAGVVQMSHHLPILSRAWVYQERLLSRRMVHYTRYEALFECSAGVDNMCECQNSPGGNFNGSSPNGVGVGDSTTLRKMNHAVALKETNSALIRRYWHQIMAEYSGYEISFVSDRLPALAGVARQFGTAHPELGRYVAGLWENTMVYDLMWVSAQLGLMPRPSLPEGISFPSWSWISVGHYVKINSGCPRVYPDDLEVLGFEVEAGSADEYGAIVQVSLKLAGFLAEGKLVTVQIAGKIRAAFQGDQGDPIQFYPDIPLLESELNPRSRLGSTIFCMKTGFAWGGNHLCLILRKSESDTGAFERIGMIDRADRPWVDCVFQEDAPKQEVKLV